MKRTSLVRLPLFIGLLMLPLWAVAGTFSYPNTYNPLFSMDIPDGWKVEIEDEVLHAAPPDESVYLGFWALDTSVSGDVVGEAVEQIVGSMIRNPSIDSEENLQVNGIPLYYFEGHGRSTEGGPMNYGVAMFSPDGNTGCIVIYFGPPADEKRHERALIGIIESIRRG